MITLKQIKELKKKNIDIDYSIDYGIEHDEIKIKQIKFKEPLSQGNIILEINS